MKKKLAAICAAVLLIGSLAGCDPAENPASSDPDSSGPDEPIPNPGPDEPKLDLSKFTTSTDSNYFNAVVDSMNLYADNFVTIGDAKYEENMDLPDISEKFATAAASDHKASEFNVQKINGIEPSGISKNNDGWPPYTPFDSHIYQIDFKQSYDIADITVQWKGNASAKGKLQVSDDGIVWYNVNTSFVLRKGGEATKEEVHETQRRYLRMVFTSSVNLDDITDVVINGNPSSAVTAPSKGPSTTVDITDLEGWKTFPGYEKGTYAPYTVWPTPDAVAGTARPVISLSGKWKFNKQAPDRFWDNSTDVSSWVEATVPGDPDNENLGVRLMEGVNGIESPSECHPIVYKMRTTIPEDYAGKEVLLRFESVMNYARVWVNGYLVRTHRNGYTTFDCRITDYVQPGMDAIITVEATFEYLNPDFHLSRGILGDVKLMAVPKQSISRLQWEADFSDNYQNAVLHIDTSLFSATDCNGEVRFELTDPDGNPVALENPSVAITQNNPAVARVSNPIKNVQLWDAEHPRLYTLTARLFVDGAEAETVVRKVGFKEIKVDGNKALVNGKQVKLRGVNWMSVSPSNGLASNYWTDRESLIKLKAANVNYIRTAHHPQKDYFFALCDELGFYVEHETALVFNCVWNPNFYERYELLCNPKYLDVYLSYYAETVEQSRSRASLFMYSLGNESDWGVAVETGRNYMRAVDPKHLTKFSWGHRMPSMTSTDIYSLHYPNLREMNGRQEAPTIYDEFAHTDETITAETDPSSRDSWPIDKYWDAIYNQDGGLGGGIWCGRDQATLTDQGILKYFPRYWGILDIWNREKLEYWATRKAYSPVKIDETTVFQNPGSGNELSIPVENRYFHTNLKDIVFECTVNDETVSVASPDVEPMGKGALAIPGREWKDGDVIYITVRNPGDVIENFIVDEYRIILGGQEAPQFADIAPGGLDLQESEDRYDITGDRFAVSISKETGKILSGSYDNQEVLVGGPDLNLGTYIALSKWNLEKLSVNKQGDSVLVSTTGSYNTLKNVQINMEIDGAGQITTTYTADLPGGNIDELGVSFQTTDLTNQSWERRQTRWSTYPEDSALRLSGNAPVYRGVPDLPLGTKPTWSWWRDGSGHGIVSEKEQPTKEFRSKKLDLYQATVYSSEKKAGLLMKSDGKGSMRITGSDGSFRVFCNDAWGTVAIETIWIQYPIPIKQTTGQYTGKVVVQLVPAEK